MWVTHEVHREQELRMDGLSDQRHLGFVERAVPLVEVTLQAGRDSIDPGRFPTLRSRNNVIDGQSLPLQLPATPPTRFTSAGRAFDIETIDTNGDGKNDYVVSFPQSPFDGRTHFEFEFVGKWNQAVRFRIDCAIPSGANGVDTASAQTADDGQPIYFVADQTRRVSCMVLCRNGVTCKNR